MHIGEEMVAIRRTAMDVGGVGRQVGEGEYEGK